MKSNVQRSYEGVLHYLRQMFEPSDGDVGSDTVEVLRGTSLFNRLSGGQLRFLAKAIHVRVFSPSEFVYHENDPGLGMYIVRSGVIKLTTLDDAGNDQELSRVHSGSFFGEISMLGEFRRFETAQAVTEATLFGFFRPDLSSITKRDPRLGADIATALGQHMAEQHVAILRRIAEREGKYAAQRIGHRTVAPLDEGQTTRMID